MKFKFDNRLFQRGQTWRECLESWGVNRQDLLLRSKSGRPLQQTSQKLTALPEGSRIAVYYGQWSVDSVKTLPHLGKTLETSPKVTCRFFCEEVFYPMMNEPFGRKVPKLLLLDGQGWVINTWGPRPKAITEEMRNSQLKGTRLDDWLLGYDEQTYLEKLDPSMAALFD